MQYFVTIYIHPMSLNATTNFSEVLGIPHAFLGLTYTHPDELDKQDKKIRQEKLKNADWKDFDKSRIL